ncbi:MAG: DUF58 domain-containing protein [Euzebyales bacterium]|nr:DUF58 domain-containing protein [Euzebyales bacterium]
MTRRPTYRLGAYVALAVVAVVGGLALARPELVALAAPSALLVGLGLVAGRRLDVAVSVTVDRQRGVEGQDVELLATLTAVGHDARMEVAVVLPDGLAAVDDATIVGLKAGESRSLRIPVRCERWGAYRLGGVRLRVVDPYGMFNATAATRPTTTLKVYPQAPVLRRLLAPLETQLQLGTVRSRHRATGVELAELRPYAPGDDARAISWRATARRQELWVAERHPERSGDVVLVLDTLAEARAGAAGTLDLAVRAATVLLSGHLARRDRVGVVGLGGTVTWLRPGMGAVQRYRLVDALLTSRILPTAVWAGAAGIPVRALPPQALVIGLSPLLDERVVRAFADLAGRSVDMALVELDPDAFLPPVEGESDRLARRLWALERDNVRRRFLRRGVAVAAWQAHESFETPLARLEAFRRTTRRASA